MSIRKMGLHIIEIQSWDNDKVKQKHDSSHIKKSNSNKSCYDTM